MMLSVHLRLFLALWGIALAAAQQASLTASAPAPAFTYNSSDFLLHGEPYMIIGGQMDPQRIPSEYWRDRLAKARAMGLNTIFSYVFWDNLEPEQGQWLSNLPENDIATYFKTAQEEGLNVVLRPGPYICGEHEWGGFPAWLSQVPGMEVRSFNEPFLDYARGYIEKLANLSGLADLQVSRGGPILMVQVENEYGSYGDDHNYTAAMRDILRANFEVPLYTNDGGVDWTLEGGAIPHVLAEVDGGSWALPARDEYVTDPSELGPLLDGEYYTLAPDQWCSYNPHNTTVGDPDEVATILSDIDYHLGNVSASISFYMVHGGTNFGFQNGALWQNRTTVFTTSYDYGAPIDESGRTTDLYYQMRSTIAKYVDGTLPEPPANLPRASVPSFSLCPTVALFDSLGEGTSSESPLTMEDLGQSYGFTLYEHKTTSTLEGNLQPGDRPRDRVLVYINGNIQGVMDSQYQHPLNVSVSLKPGDRLQLLVENLGRVDYYSRGNPYQNMVIDPFKGVKGNVTVGGQVISGWDMYPLQLDSLPSGSCDPKRTAATTTDSDSPMFYKGSFTGPAISNNSTMTLDTFLGVPNGVKGNVWVNDFHLGRYWLVGPQQSLYLPGSVVKSGTENEVVILELEPWQMNTTSMVANGASERVWGNNPDPDCLKCV